MENDSNRMVNSDNHKMDIKAEIKQDPNGTSTLIKAKSEDVSDFHSETVFAFSQSMKHSVNSSETNGKELCNKIEIKEEPSWSEGTSDEIKQERELPSAADADLKNDIKETTSFAEMTTGDMATEVSRMYTKSDYRSYDTAPSLFLNSEEYSDSEIAETSHFLNFCQPQMIEEPEANSVLDSNMNGTISVQSSKTPHTCEICGKSFRCLSRLKHHNIVSHEGIKPYTCEICNNGFTQPYSLKQHKLTHEGIRLQMCEICNKSFIRPSHLKQHMLTHEGKRLHICEICNKSFIRSAHLKQHMLTHEGKRLHVCELCNKSFIRAAVLRMHRLTHVGVKPYKCEICSKNFTQASNLNKHKLTHEGKKPYTCEICYNSFTQASNLKRHILSHEGKRPHTCEICNKGFIRLSNLKEHRLTHERKTSYTCEICNKSYKRSSNLKQHKLTHEGSGQPT